MLITDEMINRIRQSGYVHGIEDLREELLKEASITEEFIVMRIDEFSKLVERMERGYYDGESNKG